MVGLFFFGTSLIASQYYSLLYRITAVLRSPTIRRRFLSLPSTVLFLSLVAIAACAVGYGVYLTTWNDPVIFAGYLWMLTQKEYITEADKSFGRFNIYENFTFTLGISIAIVSIFLASQAFFAGCGLWVIRSVGIRLAESSKRTREMHLQFTRLLLLQMPGHHPPIQMLCPVVFMVVPLVYFFYMTVSGSFIPLVAAYVCLLCMSLSPMVNALLTVVFVKPYRIHTLNWMRVVFHGNVVGGRESQWDSSSSQQDEPARRRTVAVIVIPK